MSKRMKRWADSPTEINENTEVAAWCRAQQERRVMAKKKQMCNHGKGNWDRTDWRQGS